MWLLHSKSEITSSPYSEMRNHILFLYHRWLILLRRRRLLLRQLVPSVPRYRLPLPRSRNPHWTIDTFQGIAFQEYLRFTRAEFLHLLHILNLGDEVKTEHGYICEPAEGLAVMLYRLSYPCRYKDMALIFTKFSIPKLSDIYNKMLDILYHSFKKLLAFDSTDRATSLRPSPRNLNTFLECGVDEGETCGVDVGVCRCAGGL